MIRPLPDGWRLVDFKDSENYGPGLTYVHDDSGWHVCLAHVANEETLNKALAHARVLVTILEWHKESK